MPTINHFGPFYGQDLGPDEADVLAIAHIDQKVLKRESELMTTKWFDYRLLHPTVATYLFAHHYTKAYQRYIAITQDFERAPFVKGFKGQDFFMSREKGTFWKMRQRADESCMRYDFFMNNAINYCIAAGWRQPPRPAHIYTNADMIIDINNSWDEETKARLQFPKDPAFRVENFTGSREQLAFEKWIMDQVAKRAHRKYSLHSAIYVEGMLRIESALERFGYEAVDSASEHAIRDYELEQQGNLQ